MSDPVITVSILSWLLENRLIRTLQSIPKTTSMPLNLCLHVQGSEQISDKLKQEILDATSKFHIRDVFFTIHNNGAAVPRANLMTRSAITPYVFITDNDMDFQPGSIDALYEFLQDNPSYGMVDLVHNYLRWHRTVDGTKVNCFPVNFDGPKVVDVDLIGAASIMMRKEVSLLPNLIDRRYHLGTWDFDMCLNVKKAGWKIATIQDKSLIAVNDKTHRTPTYKKRKVYHPIRHKGLKIFEQKWGFSSEFYPRTPKVVKPIPSDTSIITRAIFTSVSEEVVIGSLTQKRLKMMQEHLINSLLSQTDQDFILHIITGPQHNEATKAIEALDYGSLNKQFIYTETDLSQWKVSAEKYNNWGRELDPGCPEDLAKRAIFPYTTIMARIDIDDWVTPGWVSSMKYLTANLNKESFLINYQVIGQGFDGRNYKFFAPHVKHRTSPFIAVVQKGDKKISPYEDTHLRMGKLFNTVITIPPAYCFMVVHGENRSNRIYSQDQYLEDIAIGKHTGDQPNLNPNPKPGRSENHWKTRIIRGQERLKIKQSMGAPKCPETNSFAIS